ncbi:MAG: beta-lactamase family protein [Akkermansiaceae bacterium]|nr:beta-lactamase family protein [Akkermansiaceae bacterium]
MNISTESNLTALLLSEAFSGVAVVRHNGETLVKFAGGLADRDTGRPNTLVTRFATASVGKMFTATCLARLEDAGLCQLSQPLADVVPSLAAHFDKRMSLASLLSHRSGLGDYINDDSDLPFAGMDVARLDRPGAFLPYVLKAPQGAPREFSYSSAGFILLGLAIEELTGMSYPEAMDHWVLEPAGLRSTGFPPMDDPPTDFANGYLPDGRTNAGHLPRIGGPDGGIVTTAADLQSFFGCLRSGDFLSQSARSFLWQEQGRINAISDYGHGFYLTPICGGMWPGHTGSDPGVSARVAFSPHSNSSIIVLCNRDEVAFDVFRLAMEHLNALAS